MNFFSLKVPIYTSLICSHGWLEINELFICDSVQVDKTKKGTHGKNKEKRAKGEKLLKKK